LRLFVGAPKLRSVFANLSFISMKLGAAVTVFVLAAALPVLSAQQPGDPSSKAPTTFDQKSHQGTDNKPATGAGQTPAQIELLETHIRFETDGSSRKEVHARVRINTELGTRQFARLNFDYNRAFETVEIPLARITHAGGGTADILPSAVTDQPNPIVVDAPAYQDIRRKTVRILGLQPTDILEYRVVTTAHAPLAPDFYLFHTFAKDAIVTQEQFELNLPSSRDVQLRVNPATAPSYEGKTGEGSESRMIRRWEYRWNSPEGKAKSSQDLSTEPDVALTTFTSWKQLSTRLAEKFEATENITPVVLEKSNDLTKSAEKPEEKIEAIYDFVSQKITTVELPLESNGFRPRPPAEILSTGYATPEDKMVLFSALTRAAHMPAIVAFAGAPDEAEKLLPRPSLFSHALVWTGTGKEGRGFWLDPSTEVAPFRMIGANLRGKPAFLLLPDTRENSSQSPWVSVPVDLPFAASQHVNVDSVLAADGQLSAKVHYSLRGDNELLLRVAFHQTPKEKWGDLAQLLSISDGFRGQVASVNASDPSNTRQPFSVDYEIVMPKFVDWSKKPVRIPALLPQLGLPDASTMIITGGAASPIDLGTPLDVDTRATLQLPAATTAHAPTGTSVERDYATYASKYLIQGPDSAGNVTLTASRRLRFLLREVPASRVTDYKAFLHAVQNDEAQDFTLERPASADDHAKPGVKKTFTPTQP
jgi:transglutaminase-like putative cysteine protease